MNYILVGVITGIFIFAVFVYIIKKIEDKKHTSTNYMLLYANGKRRK